MGLRIALVALVVLAQAAAAHARPAEPGLERLASALREALPLANAPPLIPGRPTLRAGGAEVEIEMRFTALTPARIAAARARGAHVERASLRYARIVARAPLAALPELATLPELSAIHPLYGAHVSAGSVRSQVDEVMAVADARAAFAVDGSGVTVGLLSNSIHNRHGGRLLGDGCDRILTDSAPQRSGDLPGEVIVLDPGPGSGNDEGTGMAEIVHDLAPGAGLSFASAFPDEATFAENITALRACGADVIADDVLFFAEPMFQDGIVAQSARDAVRDGAMFFSAATNAGDAGIDQPYRDSHPLDETADPPTGVDLHDFGDGRPYTAVTIPAGCDMRFILQWSEPFSGTLGPGAAVDLDLYVYSDRPPAREVARSTNTQGCAPDSRMGDPLEIAVVRRGGPRTVYVAVDHFCGREDVRLRLVAFGNGCILGRDRIELERPPFGGAAIYGHPAAEGVVAVAAVDQLELASDGTFAGDPSRLDPQPYSSFGGALPFYFDDAGAPLAGAPLVRHKPELTAADGADTAFFGVDTDDNGFPNFHGTSAAAPAAAAVAALLRDAAPRLDGATLVEILRKTAVDIGPPGADVQSGDGLVDAGAALAALSGATTGDCDGDGAVTIAELVLGVGIALGHASPSACAALDADGDGRVTIDELIAAVNAALG